MLLHTGGLRGNTHTHTHSIMHGKEGTDGYLVKPEGKGNNIFLVSGASKHLMLIGVLVEICLPVVLGCIDSLQISLQHKHMVGNKYRNMCKDTGNGSQKGHSLMHCDDLT